MSKAVIEVGLGGDPEFMLQRNNGERVSAGEILNGGSAFGCDGCSTIGELRPGYSNNLFEVVDKSKQIMETAYKGNSTIRTLAWLAGHYKHGQAIGGHIHIAFSGATHASRMLARYYDAYLSDCLSDLIDPINERQTRRGTGYGNKWETHRNAIESKGPDRFEYRTPGSWLISPIVTIANLAIAKIVTIGHIMDVLPESVKRNTAEEKRAAIDELWSIVPNLPDDVKKAHPFVQQVIHVNSPIDWDADFKGAWLE